MTSASVILFASERSKSEVERIAQLINDDDKSDLIIIGESSLDGLQGESSLVACDNRNLSDCLSEATSIAQSDNILVMDARLPMSSVQMAQMINKTSVEAAERLIYIPIDLIDEDYDIGSLDAEAMVQTITRDAQWPVMIVGCSKTYLRQVAREDADSCNELMARLFILALSEGTSVERADESIRPSESVCSEMPGRLTKLGQARTLGMIINSFAIEDLFTNLPWGDYSEESAASAYHSLAALFIRLDDTMSATECLRLSDQFQESPRSWALRGIIASSKGETLGAVANMVSSLQQYEERKKDDKGYIKYRPSNLEVINSSLVSGLEALNRRDNEKALDCFSEAVFNFDAFYGQYKLTRARNGA